MEGIVVNLPVGRLAPSPTGAQHIGNARTFLLAWLSIRSRGGRLILRMEDIDSPRIKTGADQQAVDDLRWLGLDWDEGPDVPGANAPYYQTQRLDIYRPVLDALIAAEMVYPCTCTRTDIANSASAPHAEHEGPIYPGTCSHRRAADASDLSDRPFSWRLRSQSPGMEYRDLVLGPQSIEPTRTLGDFVVWKSSQTPAYQLAVVADDIAMGVTEVLRGSDLVPSTFRQLELYTFLQRTPPTFAHIPLVVGPDGKRLAKRHGDTRLATLRDAGVRPEDILGLLAWSAGLLPEIRSIQLAQLLDVFDLAKIPKGNFVLTTDHLRCVGFPA